MNSKQIKSEVIPFIKNILNIKLQTYKNTFDPMNPDYGLAIVKRSDIVNIVNGTFPTTTYGTKTTYSQYVTVAIHEWIDENPLSQYTFVGDRKCVVMNTSGKAK